MGAVRREKTIRADGSEDRDAWGAITRAGCACHAGGRVGEHRNLDRIDADGGRG